MVELSGVRVTSHVLENGTYDLDFSAGSIDNILEIWDNCNYNTLKLRYHTQSVVQVMGLESSMSKLFLLQQQ